MLTVAAGVMIAASFWSLLAPSIKWPDRECRDGPPPTVGFLLGGAFFGSATPCYLTCIPGRKARRPKGCGRIWQRTTLLVLAITLHNVPEGLAVGVAFGAAASGVEIAGAGTLGAAIALTIGIGLQQFPRRRCRIDAVSRP